MWVTTGGGGGGGRGGGGGCWARQGQGNRPAIWVVPGWSHQGNGQGTWLMSATKHWTSVDPGAPGC